MVLDPRYSQLFVEGLQESKKFWRRLDGKPLLEGKRIADVGCGLGSLCVDLAISGATRVTGIDVNARRIEFAREILERSYPELRSRIDYECILLENLPARPLFDYIVSKDTFEHADKPESLLHEMIVRLEAGGRIYLGFGPLYHSPTGDHGLTRMPWGHLFLSDAKLRDRFGGEGVGELGRARGLGLNRWPLERFRDLFRDSGLREVLFDVNRGRNPALKAFNLAGRIPGLAKYLAHNVYCILEKGAR